MEYSLEGTIKYFLEWTRKNLQFVVYLFALSMLYIWNNHKAISLIREINFKAKELKELRWEYLTKKSDLMYKSKLSEVTPKAKEMNLITLDKPPYRITLEKKEFEHQE
jgi:hypothetical protein